MALAIRRRRFNLLALTVLLWPAAPTTAFSHGLGADFEERLAFGLRDAGVRAYYAQDYEFALEVFRNCASRGLAACQFNLGLMYENGSGVTQDFVRADKWYIVAIAHGKEMARESRVVIGLKMTAAQTAEAERLAQECLAYHQE